MKRFSKGNSKKETYASPPVEDTTNLAGARQSKAPPATSAEDLHGGVEDLSLNGEWNDKMRFRVLIIGKTGCGKTTILEKVCGSSIADVPSEKRGIHNIDKELISEENGLFVAHDSMGFEAGSATEIEVVLDFMKRRAESRTPKDHLHAIWYCMQAGPRPVQEAEKMFFNAARRGKVPVIAIMTKFDMLVEERAQTIMESGECEDEDDEDAAFEQAEVAAAKVFEEHFENVLKFMEHPPTKVIKLSNVNSARRTNGVLRDLITATMDSFEGITAQRMKFLFSSAQNIDCGAKISTMCNYLLTVLIIPERAVDHILADLISIWGWHSIPSWYKAAFLKEFPLEEPEPWLTPRKQHRVTKEMRLKKAMPILTRAVILMGVYFVQWEDNKPMTVQATFEGVIRRFKGSDAEKDLDEEVGTAYDALDRRDYTTLRTIMNERMGTYLKELKDGSPT